MCKLASIQFVGTMKKQKEKAATSPQDLKETDIITIVTGYDELSEKHKSEDIKEIYAVIKEQFDSRGLETFPEFK